MSIPSSATRRGGYSRSVGRTAATQTRADPASRATGDDPRPVLALDVGGTKLAAAVVDRGGRVLTTARVPTPRPDGGPDGGPANGAAETVWRTLVRLITEVTTQAGMAGNSGFAGVGVGCGGPMDWRAGVVSPLNLPAWRDFPLRDRLRKLYPGTPVRVHNDAVCTAVGEHWRGSGRGHDTLLGMVVSTGVGGGLISEGRLLDGRTGNAGHIGHVVVDADGPACSCGGRGCLEAVARGPALVEWAREQGWSAPPEATARELTEDAWREEPTAVAALERAGSALGIAIASVAAVCDLETVAVGGGLSQAGPLLFEPLEKSLRRYACLPFTNELTVVPVALGQEAGLVGAAALLLTGDRYWHQD